MSGQTLELSSLQNGQRRCGSPNIVSFVGTSELRSRRADLSDPDRLVRRKTGKFPIKIPGIKAYSVNGEGSLLE